MLHCINYLTFIEHNIVNKSHTQIQPRKADTILQDSEVQSELGKHPDLVVCQEGFSSPSELSSVSPLVSCVVLGEELLGRRDTLDINEFRDSVKQWADGMKKK